MKLHDWVVFQGRIIETKNCKVSPLNLMFGEGFFETIKIANNTPEFLSQHLYRIKKSLNYFKIPFPKYNYKKLI